MQPDEEIGSEFLTQAPVHADGYPTSPGHP